MTSVKPFCGVRYDAKELSSLICPPYDIIPPEEKERLKKLSPNNMVRLELSDPAAGKNKYAAANALFKAWRAKGVLITDEDPAFYFYEQQFVDHGKKMTRRGFFAALKLENPHGGGVKPHERTLAKPKEDRLKLLRAVKANLSPIFGLFYDPKGIMPKLGKKITAQKPLATARDREKTFHRLWKVTDPEALRLLSGALASQKIFIADGHHRYETAWNYLQEQKKKDRSYSASSPYNNVMIYLCPMEDPGLSIWPTHRVVTPPAAFDERVCKYFNVLPAAAFEKLEKKSPQPLLVCYKGACRTLTVKNAALLKKMMPGKCRAYRELGVSILHSLLLPDVLPENITYVKDEEETLALAKKTNRMAVIVPATPVQAIKEIALAGQTMPQKSTYFYPKVATGIVVHAFKDK